MQIIRKATVFVIPLLFFDGCGFLEGLQNPQPKRLEENRQITYISQEMRGKNATDAILGAIGEKVHRTKGDKGYFQKFHVPKYQNMKINQVGQVKITESIKAELGSIGVDVVDLIKMDTGLKREGSQNLQVNLLNVESTLDLQRELWKIANADPEIKAYLSRPEARIITMVGTVTNYEIKTSTDGKVDLTAGKTAGKYAVKTNLGSGYQHIDEFVISPQATVLYRMSKVCWTNDGNSLFLKVDYFGGDPCSPTERK